MTDSVDRADERPPSIVIRCVEPGCDTEFYGELSTWWAVYTSGEVWRETCPGCGCAFVATLLFRRISPRESTNARLCRWLLRTIPAGDGISHSALRRKVRYEDRPLFGTAIDLLIRSGQVHQSKSARGIHYARNATR